MTSPAQRSLKYLRDMGLHAQVVERWNAYAKVRQDLFQFIDIVAVGNGSIVGVQTTTQDNVSARIEKARGNEALREWVKAGGSLVIHGWAKRGPRGKRKVWTVTERKVTEEDLDLDKRESKRE